MAALEDCSHDQSHNHIGGNSMCCPKHSAQDPFFFMLHGEVDRLWAQWQRNPSDLLRLDPTQTYGASRHRPKPHPDHVTVGRLPGLKPAHRP